jgi:hypothetical protein
MKKVYTVCITLLIMNAALGQNWVNGGNTLSANGTIGTNSSHSLLFETAGMERGRITNGGSWGIGSTGTTSRFTINAASSISPFRAQINGGTKLIVGTNGGVSVGTATAGPANGLYVVGNVGIGIANPSYKLQVAGSVGATSVTATNIYGNFLSVSGSGISGYSSSSAGVTGQSGSGYGVQGYSTSAIGVYGQSNAAFSAGLYGVSAYIGVQGVSSGTDAGRQAVRGENNGSTTGYAGFFNGKVWVYGTLVKNAGSFKIDHPLDPANKFLSHSFVESPDMKNIYDGVVTTDKNGKATVTLPDYFEALNKDFRYQLTPVGKFSKVVISKEIMNNQFEIETSEKNVVVSWQITGTRIDAYAEANRIQVEELKEGNDIGRYIYPQGFGKDDKEILAIGKPMGDNTESSPFSPQADKFIATNEIDAFKNEYTPSDERLKKNITDLNSALTLVNKLHPKEYEFRQDQSLTRLNLPTGKRYGLVAQDLEQVIPVLVNEIPVPGGGKLPAGARLINEEPAENSDPNELQTNESYKTVNYTELIPFLIRSIQELDSARRSEAELLRSEIAQLKEVIEKLDGQSLDVSKGWIRQNTPNPVSTSATINYSISPDAKAARILFTNSKGQQMRIYNVAGAGTLNFAAGTLPSGTYNYSLIVDGKTVSTKKLVVAR